ncbi:glycosyltransferase family 2 protein [Candidatus Woesearchaeota archaeon]|nr:glycosyltransferase family 2 protein [Candidatus Woesearchaeota archaeon]
MSFGVVLIYVATFFGLFTSFYFFLTLLERRDDLNFGECASFPKVSVCVPCYNEEGTVVKTLRSLRNLDYPRDRLEVIVVDDGSDDRTFERASAFARRFSDTDIKVLRKENGGKYTALNLAIKRASGSIFGALDADSFVDRKALRRIVKVFENKGVTAVTPSMKVYDPRNILQHLQYAEYLFGIFLRKVFAGLGAIHVTPGPFSFYRMSFLRRSGGFRKAYHTEDIELALRAQQQHRVIDNAVDAYVYTVAPRDFRTLWKQRVRWYYGFLKNVFEKRDLFSVRHGNLGLIMLPSSLISIGITVLILFYTSFVFFSNVVTRVLNWIAINFNFFELKWNFDAFYINTSPTAILGLIGLVISITMFAVAKRISGEKRSIVWPYLTFIFLYPLLYPVWWLAAIWKIVGRRRVEWGHKSEVTRRKGGING